jgi:hypothetical protein
MTLKFFTRRLVKQVLRQHFLGQNKPLFLVLLALQEFAVDTVWKVHAVLDSMAKGPRKAYVERMEIRLLLATY